MTSIETKQKGKEAVKTMRNILSRKPWTNHIHPLLIIRDVRRVKRKYKEARYTAMACGVDVTKYPKRVRWQELSLSPIETQLMEFY